MRLLLRRPGLGVTMRAFKGGACGKVWGCAMVQQLHFSVRVCNARARVWLLRGTRELSRWGW
jgi:hypothetical protein